MRVEVVCFSKELVSFIHSRESKNVLTGDMFLPLPEKAFELGGIASYM